MDRLPPCPTRPAEATEFTLTEAPAVCRSTPTTRPTIGSTSFSPRAVKYVMRPALPLLIYNLETLSRVGLREREFESGFRLVAETYSIVGRSLGVRWPQGW